MSYEEEDTWMSLSSHIHSLLVSIVNINVYCFFCAERLPGASLTNFLGLVCRGQIIAQYAVCVSSDCGGGYMSYEEEDTWYFAAIS